MLHREYLSTFIVISQGIKSRGAPPLFIMLFQRNHLDAGSKTSKIVTAQVGRLKAEDC